MKTTTTPPAPVLMDLPLASLQPDKANPRATVGNVAELAQSIAAHGILQPLRVQAAAGGVHQIVFGHRRHAAALEAGLESAPCMVGALSAQEVLEQQIVENVQRTDLHPMEEAEGYQRLLDMHHSSIADLSARAGKSESYVYGRMKLLDLEKAGRKAFRDGWLSPSTALLVARTPSRLQKALLSDLKRGYSVDSPMPFRRAVELVKRTYTLKLAGAPFDTKDSSLLPTGHTYRARGACSECPLSTACNSTLFGDMGKDDLCTDPKCFQAKKDVGLKAAAVKAKAKGQEFLSGKAAAAVFGTWGFRHGSTGYVDLADPVDKYGASKRTWASVCKGADVPVTLCPDSEGRIHRLVTRAQIRPALKKAGKLDQMPKKAAGSSSVSARTPAQKKREAKLVHDGLVAVRASEGVLDAVSTWERPHAKSAPSSPEVARDRAVLTQAARLLVGLGLSSGAMEDLDKRLYTAWHKRVGIAPPANPWIPTKKYHDALEALVKAEPWAVLRDMVALAAAPDAHAPKPDAQLTELLALAPVEWTLLASKARAALKAEAAKAVEAAAAAKVAKAAKKGGKKAGAKKAKRLRVVKGDRKPGSPTKKKATKRKARATRTAGPEGPRRLIAVAPDTAAPAAPIAAESPVVETEPEGHTA